MTSLLKILSWHGHTYNFSCKIRFIGLLNNKKSIKIKLSFFTPVVDIIWPGLVTKLVIHCHINYYLFIRIAKLGAHHCLQLNIWKVNWLNTIACIVINLVRVMTTRLIHTQRLLLCNFKLLFCYLSLLCMISLWHNKLLMLPSILLRAPILAILIIKITWRWALIDTRLVNNLTNFLLLSMLP